MTLIENTVAFAEHSQQNELVDAKRAHDESKIAPNAIRRSLRKKCAVPMPQLPQVHTKTEQVAGDDDLPMSLKFEDGLDIKQTKDPVDAKEGLFLDLPQLQTEYLEYHTWTKEKLQNKLREKGHRPSKKLSKRELISKLKDDLSLESYVLLPDGRDPQLLTCKELRRELEQRHLSSSGLNKDQLIKSLIRFISNPHDPLVKTPRDGELR